MRFVAITVLALLGSPALSANLFKCKGSDGVTVFQHTPCANVADTQARYRYERLPDAPNRVMSEREFVNRNRKQRANQAVNATVVVPAASPAMAADNGCIRDRFTPAGECLGSFGEYNAAARAQAELDRANRRHAARTSANRGNPPGMTWNPSAQVRDHTGQVQPHAHQVGPGVILDAQTGQYSYGANQNADGSVTTQPK